MIAAVSGGFDREQAVARAEDVKSRWIGYTLADDVLALSALLAAAEETLREAREELTTWRDMLTTVEDLDHLALNREGQRTLILTLDGVIAALSSGLPEEDAVTVRQHESLIQDVNVRPVVAFLRLAGWSEERIKEVTDAHDRGEVPEFSVPLSGLPEKTP